MDFSKSLYTKKFFRFTGPPEHWLTAIKFMTWGLEEKYKQRWNEIQTGDIFFIHSTGAQTSLFDNAKSGIIGLGVIGSNFSIKNNYLWMREYKDSINRWPLLVPLSEIYLFSEIPDSADWNPPSLNDMESVKILIDALLKNYIPLSKITGFPQMGSFSSVSTEAADQILYDKRPLYLYADDNEGRDSIIISKPTKLETVKNVSETLRYADTLTFFDSIKKRIIKEKSSVYTKDNELLARAENAHYTILQQLIDFFRKRGFETRFNKYVDLFAYNEKRSFLIEVKSTENKNFRAQARKGIVQLFESDYFDIGKFVKENNLDFQERFRILTPSQKPRDDSYVKFINNLDIGIAMVDEESLEPVGVDFGFSKV